MARPTRTPVESPLADATFDSEPRSTEATLRVLGAAEAHDTFRVDRDGPADPLNAELDLLDTYLGEVRRSDIVPSMSEPLAS